MSDIPLEDTQVTVKYPACMIADCDTGSGAKVIDGTVPYRLFYALECTPWQASNDLTKQDKVWFIACLDCATQQAVGAITLADFKKRPADMVLPVNPVP